jgi:CBS domain containing-hemolysin-like protein
MFYYFTVFCIYLFYPLNVVFSGWRWLICKLFKVKKEASITEEELINIVETAENEGEIEAHESELIRSAIEFEDREVIDVMVPRVNVVAIEIEDSAEEIYQKYVESGYSRLPVYKDTIDNIVGILHEKDFYRQIHDHSGEIKDIIQTTLCVPSSMKISSALHEIQRNKVHMAIVVDEFGGTMGVVTLEDILEELVGEIYDEHDDVEELFRKISEDTYVVSGEENLEEMFENLDITINENEEDEQIDATSVGGFVTEIMDKIPQEGEKCSFKNLEIEILKATSTKVVEIKIKVLPIKQD